MLVLASKCCYHKNILCLQPISSRQLFDYHYSNSTTIKPLYLYSVWVHYTTPVIFDPGASFTISGTILSSISASVILTSYLQQDEPYKANIPYRSTVTNRIFATTVGTIDSLRKLVSLNNSIHSIFDNGLLLLVPVTTGGNPIPIPSGVCNRAVLPSGRGQRRKTFHRPGLPFCRPGGQVRIMLQDRMLEFFDCCSPY